MNSKRSRYGYSYADEERTRYKINESEASIIRRIDTLYLQGYSQQKLAELLTYENIPTPMGKSTWNHTTISGILNCTEYHGEGYAYKTLNFIDETGRKRYRRKAPGDSIKLPQELYPIIRSKEIYDAIQERMRNGHSTANSSKVPQDMLLRGFIRCSICGRVMVPVMETSRWNGIRYEYPAYRCNALPNGTLGPETRHRMQAVAHSVEQGVSEYVKELLGDLSIIQCALLAYMENNASQMSVEAYDNAIAQLKQQQEELADDLVNTRGNVRSMLLTQMNKLEDEIEQLETHKHEVKSEDGRRWEHVKRGIQEVIEWLETGNSDFDNASFEQKQNILRALGIVVFVQKGTKQEGKAVRNEYEVRVTLPTLDTSLKRSGRSSSPLSRACATSSR